MDIATRRLHSQRLAGEPLAGAVDVVGWLGAVQSQDYPAATWAIGQRTRGAIASTVDRLFDDGAILRTHVLRPTWHFVLPGDIRWLLALTAPRIRAGLAGRLRALELDAATITRAETAITTALGGGRRLTRPELGEVLRATGIAPDGQRLPHLIMAAELDALIVSGPRRRREFTYALFDERVPSAPALDREQALCRLAHHYFRSRGPAQVQDLAWWAGLTLAEAARGAAGAEAATPDAPAAGTPAPSARPDAPAVGTAASSARTRASSSATAASAASNAAATGLASELIDGKRYWFDPGSRPRSTRKSAAHLLPNFDELTVGYRDRSALAHPDGRFDPSLFAFGSLLSSVLVIGGRVRGAWRRVLSPRAVHLQVRLLDGLSASEIAAVEGAAARMSMFLERGVDVQWVGPGKASRPG